MRATLSRTRATANSTIPISSPAPASSPWSAKERFGFDSSPVAELVHWTDIIDGALYPDAKTAVEMKEPAMKLTMVIESTQDQVFVPS